MDADSVTTVVSIYLIPFAGDLFDVCDTVATEVRFEVFALTLGFNGYVMTFYRTYLSR